MGTLTRRTFLRRSSAVGGGLMGMGALQAYGARVALGQSPGASPGYGPLVAKAAQNDPQHVLRLPAAFNFEVISRQGLLMSDGNPTPGIFDGTGSYPAGRDTTVLIRNHENRRRVGEIPVQVPAGKRYDPDPTYNGGDTKLIVERRQAGRNADRSPRYTYRVLRDFAILGGTDTNCAGGVVVGDYWYTCEEVVNRSAAGVKHGYNFAIPAYANEPVKAVALPAHGRFVHEAVAELDGILYQTEDRSLGSDPTAPVVTGNPDRKPVVGASFYRFVPDRGRRGLEGPGRLQALALRDEFHANMDTGGRVVGRPYRVEWVDVPEPDHEDDTDNRRDRVPGFTPVAIQAQDRGAAYFSREEGAWTAYDRHGGGSDDRGRSRGKVYFDCTNGGAARSGQVWEYDPRRETITLIFESPGPAVLDGPDNMVIVPGTGDILLQEDAGADQFIRGVTTRGQIFDFAQTVTNATEFCGGCFDADGRTLFVSQQGDRFAAGAPGQVPPGDLQGAPESRAVTYAIYGPFERRDRRGKDD